jgi:hypothetical protein
MILLLLTLAFICTEKKSKGEIKQEEQAEVTQPLAKQRINPMC